MKKLAAIALTLILLGGLAACQPQATPTPVRLTAAPTRTPIPPALTISPTETTVRALNSLNSPPLQSFKMFTLADGWGLVTNQLLLTHDGGQTWFSVPLPGGQVDKNTQAWFLDAKNLYVLLPGADGTGGVLYAGTNGGGTWTTAQVPFGQGQLSFTGGAGYFFETRQTGADSMVVYLFKTVDQGQTWNQIQSNNSLPEAGLKTGVNFINAGRGWMGFASQKGRLTLYLTQDGGQTWAPQELQAPQNISSLVTDTLSPFFFSGNYKNGILPVDFFAQDTGDKNRVFFTTADGGDSWLPGASVIGGGAYTFVDPSNGWVWGKHGLYSTNDAGQSWQQLPVAFGRAEQATIITFVDTRNGWLVTTDDHNQVRLYNTSDSGNTWTAINP